MLAEQGFGACSATWRPRAGLVQARGRHALLIPHLELWQKPQFLVNSAHWSHLVVNGVLSLPRLTDEWTRSFIKLSL